MALKYTHKTAKIMDGDTEVATVHGLSFNAIVGLISINREAVESLFTKFQGREPDEISEDEVSAVGLEMLEKAPVLVAQIIAYASDANVGYDEDTDENPMDVIMSMPAGLQLAFLSEIGPLTFNAGGGAKKMLALALKAVRGGSQSA